MLPLKEKETVEQISKALATGLGDNLYSLFLYGSAVRGNFVEGVSDINLLMILNESTPSAHKAIAEILRQYRLIEPFVLGKRGFERSVRAFAPKFLSIRRNYQLLCGQDILASLSVDKDLECFLTEQSLRNLRLRMVHAFIKFGGISKRYERYLVDIAPVVFTAVSEVLRLEGIELPKDFRERIPIIQKQLDIDPTPLQELIDIHQHYRRLTKDEEFKYHTHLFDLLNKVVGWIETKWPKSNPKG